MDGIQETRNFPGKTARECYDAALAAFPKIGFEIWKKRDLAWFAIARRTIGDSEVTLNVMSKPGKTTEVVLGVNANRHAAEEELHRYAEEFYQALRGILRI